MREEWPWKFATDTSHAWHSLAAPSLRHFAPTVPRPKALYPFLKNVLKVSLRKKEKDLCSSVSQTKKPTKVYVVLFADNVEKRRAMDSSSEA